MAGGPDRDSSDNGYRIRRSAALVGWGHWAIMNATCRWSVRIFTVLYAAALALLAIGTFGLFGNEPGPLAGVFLIPLGLPWNRLIDFLPESGWYPWLAAAVPLVNLAIIWGVCRASARRRTAEPRS
jgi:hypothetical protein